MVVDVTRAIVMRRTETPNAVMTTVASPTQGPTQALSVWKVAMRTGQQGPRHSFDREQVWHVLSGAITVVVGEESAELRPGDAVVLAPGLERQITAMTDTEIFVCCRHDASVSVPGETGSRGTPPWVS